MIITDYNKMTIEELMAIHEFLKVNYEIENGGITKAFKENAEDE